MSLNLEQQFLETSGILPAIRESLLEVGVVVDSDRLELLEYDIGCLISKTIEPRHLEVLISFFETESGKAWRNGELSIIRQIEEITLSHISFIKSEENMKEKGLSYKSFEDESVN